MRYITANNIFNGHALLKQGSVLVLEDNGTFVEFVNVSEIDSAQLETMDGILTPGFINAHCHLELSHLHKIIPEKTGLTEFAKQIITKKNSASNQTISEAMLAADLYMKQAGIVAVGDISNTSQSFKIKQKSNIYYHTFIELIGLDSSKHDAIFNEGLSLLEKLQGLNLHGSLVPHAPYSCSLKLIETIADFNLKNNLSFSIHNQESEEENKFMQGEESEITELYKFLHLNINWFKPTYLSSLQAYAHLLKGNKNILVHNTFSKNNDIKSVKNKVFWCLCPSANLYIEGVLPDFKSFLENPICFGTDSLASNTSLDLLKEASLFYAKIDDLELTLKALCFNGANALGISKNYGQFIKGKNAGLNLISAVDKNLTLRKVIF